VREGRKGGVPSIIARVALSSTPRSVAGWRASRPHFLAPLLIRSRRFLPFLHWPGRFPAGLTVVPNLWEWNSLLLTSGVSRIPRLKGPSSRKHLGVRFFCPTSVKTTELIWRGGERVPSAWNGPWRISRAHEFHRYCLEGEFGACQDCLGLLA